MAPELASILVKPYGHVPAGQVYLVTLVRGPVRVDITNWGATITSLYLPDAKGKLVDVVLGMNSFEGYKNGTEPYFGAVVGRVANRIANGTFVLDKVRYNLTKNDGNNTLHGGKVGFDKVLWSLEDVRSDGKSPSATFSYHSFDGEQGFPGSLNVYVTYKLVRNMELLVDMKAVAGNKSTPVNLAQHTYWNLGGHKSGSILNHTIQIAGDYVTVVDKDLIPTGQLLPVQNTPYDFRKEAVIGKHMDKLKDGFDINYKLMKGMLIPSIKHHDKHLTLAAKVRDPKSGRSLEVYTNKPGLQFYTGNLLSGIHGKDGAFYKEHDALCLETQGFPNAVNQPKFPSVVVRPGQTYQHLMLYRFSNKRVA